MFFFCGKKTLSSQFCHLRILVFNLSSPVHLVSKSRGGNTSMTDRGGGRTNENPCV